MDPRYNHNWPPQAYNNDQYVPYTPQQQQPPPPNGYQHQGYAPQYPPMLPPMPQGYAQPQHIQSNMNVHRASNQQYPPMPQAYVHQQQQQQPRAQPQVIVPPRNANYVSPMQHMQAPKIRHVQMPVQRTSGPGIAQTDGAQDRRQFSNQQPSTPSQMKKTSHSQSFQENPRSQQKTSSTPVQNHHQQHRTPLQQQSTPQQRISSSSQTPSSQHRSSSIQLATPKPKAHPQVVIPGRSSSHHLTPTRHAQPPSKALPADLSVMLLSAADEYIAAARSMGVGVMRDQREADVLQYRKLMATGLGCMDTVLRDFNLVPRDEAKIRLRYASLLVEETDNTAEIDEVLSKQISLCGRSRLQDLKYASLHLQARYQFKTNHRAALKSLDKPISEAETFQHIAWVYAFRFLKVSLTLQIPGRVEVVPTLQQLHAILAHAERRGDRAVYVACNAIEALVHLRSSAGDRLEQAQRAIASARSLQLQVSAEQLGSFGTLLDIVDVACGIHNAVPDSTKSTALISSVLDETTDSLRSDTGVLTVVIERSSGGNMTADTGGVFRKNTAGRDELVFAWLPKEDLQTLCFHICALDEHLHEKGLTYSKEAHHRAKTATKRHVSPSMPISVVVAQQDWNSVLDWHSLFVISLIACQREDTTMATEALAVLRKRAARSSPNEEADRTLAYLSAVFDQRSGNLDSALRVYSSAPFQLPSQGPSAGAKTDLAILAALNRVLIIRCSGRSQQNTVTALLTQMTPLCENHPNQYIRVAHRLVYAMSSSDTTTDASIMRKKTFVQAAVNRSSDVFKKTKNREFLVMALSYFSACFFANQVSEKAVQAVRAARNTNKMGRSPLWIAVAAGMCMHTFQQNGLMRDAQEAQREYEGVMRLLPPALTRGSDVDAEGEEDDDDMV